MLRHPLTRTPVAMKASNFLTFVMRLAIKEAKKGAKHGRISVIDADAIHRRKLIHVAPYHAETKKMARYNNGV